MQVYSQQLELVKPLSSGSEAEVWLAHDSVGDEPRVFRSPRASASVHRDDLIQQIRLLRLLEESGFVGAEDVIVRDDGPPGFTGPYIASRPLREIAPEFGTPTLVEVLCLLCQSLAYLHSLDYLHADLKPDNILVEVVSGQPRPLITDLGLAVRRGGQFPMEIRGSHGYMAPEVLEGQPLAEATDVYSFGMILSELATKCPRQDTDKGLEEVADLCTRRTPAERPQTFWEVQNRLRLVCACTKPENRTNEPAPPLRHAGLRPRLRAIERVFAAANGPQPCICLVGGPPGIGKSKLMREYCLERQLEGKRTLRVTGVQSGTALLAGLGDWIPRAVQLVPRQLPQAVQWVFVEVSAGYQLTTGDLDSLRSLAATHDLRMLVEYPDPSDSRRPPGIDMVRVPPLSIRECIACSSHLTDRLTVSVANGESLRIASGGIPLLMRHFLRSWLRARNGHPQEPDNFDRLDSAVSAYWQGRFLDLAGESREVLADASVFHHEFLPGWLNPSARSIQETIPILEELVHRGWIVHTDRDKGSRWYRYAARSSRNFVRCHMGRQWLKERALGLLNSEEWNTQSEKRLRDIWEFRRLAGNGSRSPAGSELAAMAGTVPDWKQAVYATLCDYRRLGTDLTRQRTLLARSISDGFAHLGCSRRQIRWAGIALQQTAKQSAHATPCLEEARWQCDLLDIAGDLHQKEEYLTRLIAAVPPAGNGHLRGFLMSELGTLYLARSDFKQAQSACYQAHHLLKREVPVSEEFARNLNRLGLIHLFIGANETARKYLDQCRSVSLQNGWDEVGWRCLANLGIVARAMGNPEAARDQFRRAADHYRLSRDTPAYLRALSNQVPCLVDLGQGFAAMRVARLAVALAEVVTDPVRSSEACSSLGWVLTMQGSLREARATIENAIRVKLRNGDTIGASRAQLNMARLFLVADDSLQAEDRCRGALEVFKPAGDQEGCWEATRLLARAAISQDACQIAEEHLRLIPLDHPLISPRDKIETLLTWFALHLCAGDIARAQETADRLKGNPMLEHVHPLRCEMGRLLGHLFLAKGEYDQALDLLGRTATECRLSGRVDHHLPTLVVISLLAKAMGNWQVAIRNLKSAESMLDRIRGEMQ